MTKMRSHLYHSLRLARDERWASGYRRDIEGDETDTRVVRASRKVGGQVVHIAPIIDLSGYRRVSS